jgi:CDP-diacylglycerol--glycerol-3-phosphate 3-phosphatidyltransferase
VRQLPNILSTGRLILTIPLVVLILINTPAAYLVATGLFIIAAVSDTLDGRLARKYRLVSNLGVFLDLTADKVFVAALLVALVQVGLVHAWIAIVIIAREFLVAGLRSLAAAQGVVIPAGKLGKQKTLLTLCGLGGILLARGLRGVTAFPLGLASARHYPASASDWLLFAADVVLLWAVLWTILSAYEYLRGTWGLLTKPEGAPAGRGE